MGEPAVAGSCLAAAPPPPRGPYCRVALHKGPKLQRPTHALSTWPNCSCTVSTWSTISCGSRLRAADRSGEGTRQVVTGQSKSTSCSGCCRQVRRAARRKAPCCATSSGAQNGATALNPARLPNPPFPVAQNVHRIGHLQAAKKNTAREDAIASGDPIDGVVQGFTLGPDFPRISGAKRHLNAAGDPTHPT